ncbi:dolichol-phosphate mannosyltransferase subunit 3 [Phellopilus nigrolimitatus]|nr:dolichol-phosphate mannosyltransferase subunit 3 [Phellopilus nigrolimitatus]
MTRATRFTSYAGVLFTLYALVWFSVIKVPFVDAHVTDELLPVLPWWLLVSFGSYSLGSLGVGLYTFNDVPDAYEGLMKEIAEAKNDLRAKGVTVD